MPMVIVGAGPNLGAAVARRSSPTRSATGSASPSPGEVAYARMLHEELADKGVHVGHTAIAGRID